MRDLREDERDEIESVKYLVKSVTINSKTEPYKLLAALKELENISDKYVLSGIVREEELSELLDLNDMKELVDKLFKHVIEYIKEEK